MKLILGKEELKEMPRRQDFDLALNKIEKGIERAKRITLQLLGFARKDDSVLAEVNLRVLSDEAVQLVEREAVNKDIEISQEIDHSTGIIWSDPYKLRQVLINLLTNAIHATGTGGKITIMLEETGEEKILAVRDTGQGIPRENLDRIFEPFFSTKSPGEGTGLGLFVTRGIIEKLGGTIKVRTHLGEGTTFSIKLPKYYEIKEGLTKNDHAGLLAKINTAWKETNRNTLAL